MHGDAAAHQRFVAGVELVDESWLLTILVAAGSVNEEFSDGLQAELGELVQPHGANPGDLPQRFLRFQIRHCQMLAGSDGVGNHAITPAGPK